MSELMVSLASFIGLFGTGCLIGHALYVTSTDWSRAPVSERLCYISWIGVLVVYGLLLAVM